MGIIFLLEEGRTRRSWRSEEETDTTTQCTLLTHESSVFSVARLRWKVIDLLSGRCVRLFVLKSFLSFCLFVCFLFSIFFEFHIFFLLFKNLFSFSSHFRLVSSYFFLLLFLSYFLAFILPAFPPSSCYPICFLPFSSFPPHLPPPSISSSS